MKTDRRDPRVGGGGAPQTYNYPRSYSDTRDKQERPRRHIQTQTDKMAQHMLYLRFLDSKGERTLRTGGNCVEKKLDASWERMIQKHTDNGGSVDIVWDEEPAWWTEEECHACGEVYQNAWTQNHISECRICETYICETCRFNPKEDDEGDMTYTCDGCESEDDE